MSLTLDQEPRLGGIATFSHEPVEGAVVRLKIRQGREVVASSESPPGVHHPLPWPGTATAELVVGAKVIGRVKFKVPAE